MRKQGNGCYAKEQVGEAAFHAVSPNNFVESSAWKVPTDGAV
jgi:hypothetical protein